MRNDFFEKNYPQLTQLYDEYINRKEYAEHPIVEYTKPFTNDALNRALEFLKCDKKIEASDALTECACTYEQSGFILGFSFAMNFIQESATRRLSVLNRGNMND